MSTEKTFKLAGVSTLKGETKIRFANDATRVKVLLKNGHTDIDFIDMPSEMTKAEIAEFLIDIDYGAGNPAITAARDELYESTHPTPKAQKAVKVTKATKTVKAVVATTATATAEVSALDIIASALRPADSINDAVEDTLEDTPAMLDAANDIVDEVDDEVVDDLVNDLVEELVEDSAAILDTISDVADINEFAGNVADKLANFDDIPF